MLGNGILLFVMVVIGKVFGFAREIIFSYMFGTGVAADAYFSASIIPSLLNTPLTISSLVFFIPIYSKIQIQQGEKKAKEFTSNIITVYCIFNILLMLFTIISAPWLIRLVAPGLNIETKALAITLTKLLSLSFPFTVIASIFVNLSNANQKHIVPQMLNSLNNVMAVVAMLILIPKFGIFCVPVIGASCWLIQIVIQKIASRSFYKYHFAIDLKDKNLRKIVYLAVPVIIATAADQINLTVDNGLASILGQGSIAILGYGQKLFNVINGTISLVIITLTYPILSKLYAQNDIETMHSTFEQFVEVIIAVLLPVVVISVICRYDITKLVYGRGSFDENGVFMASVVFGGYIVGSIFSSIKEYTTRAFYVMDDSKTPTTINFICVLLNIILNLALVRILGLFGLAIATSLATFISAIIGIYCFRKKVSTKLTERMNTRYKSILQLIMAAVISFLCAYGTYSSLKLSGVMGCFIITVLVGCIYSGMLVIVKNPVANMAVRKLLKK